MSTASPYSIKAGTTTPDNCDTEPIHIPGCIQPYGVLLSLDRTKLTISQVSENSQPWLGCPPDAILGQPIGDILGEEGARALRTALADERVECNPLYLCTIPAADQQGPMDVTAHTHDGAVILELERAARGQSIEDEQDSLAQVKHIISRLQTAPTVKTFTQRVTEEIRKLTGLDRVMVYQFLEDNSGHVIAEDKRSDLEPYLGLHYPEIDVPLPAREMFRKIWIRPYPHVGATLAQLVPLVNPSTGRPLDMTYCFLRGASVMYTEYLQNMGVAAALTLAIPRDGKLWGLVACHHTTPKEVSHPVRVACEFLAQVVSLQLAAVEDREQAEYKSRINATYDALLNRVLPHGVGLSTFIETRPGLLDFIDADGAAIAEGGRWWTKGLTPTHAQLDELTAWLREQVTRQGAAAGIFHTQALVSQFPAAEAYQNRVSGVIAFPISKNLQDFVLWFRTEVEQVVKWGGDPRNLPIKVGPHGPRLHPRTSFALWKESVRGTSIPWKPIEIEAARRFRLAIMEIVIGQAERLTHLNRELAASNAELDAFAYVASHDLKEPLRGIYNYAYALLEFCRTRGDQAAVEKAEGLMRLAKRMDNLIDSLLRFSQVGRTDLVREEVDLNEVVSEALDMVSARRAESGGQVHIPRPLPSVLCDRMRVREVFTNLIGNALKYNDKPTPLVEVGWSQPPGGTLVFVVKDNGIGIPPKHHNRIFQIFKRLHGQSEYGGGTGAGLTITKKVVERHGGRIWVESTPGRGSSFFFTLQPEGRS